MTVEDIRALPVDQLAADNCVLFLWITWPNLMDALSVIEAWGFTYKTCAFCWTKAHSGQLEMFEQAMPDQIGLGYWTRSNSEPCVLATRGKPKRLNADVRQAIIEPRREHSRKPRGVHTRIERLVAGPYLELFARSRHDGWDVWGDDVDKFKSESWSEMWTKPFDFSREPTG
jgi:N6-adenosine-specific RNA methylase IME4